WTSAVTLPQRRNGLRARRMAVWYTFGKPVLRRHVHCAFMRSALLDMPPIMPTTACRQRNDVERYRRYSIEDGENVAGRVGREARATWLVRRCWAFCCSRWGARLFYPQWSTNSQPAWYRR